MSAPLERVLVVGASLAGLRSAEALRAGGFEGELVILGDEPHRPYDRPPLSKGLLAGAVEADQLRLASRGEIEAEYVLGEAATGLDLGARVVRTDAGREIGFDGLVIATGSRPRRLPNLDPGAEGIHELRTLDDALRLRTTLAAGGRLVIVGAGFIGVEVASTALDLGLEVEIVSLDPPLAIAGELISTVAGRRLAEHNVRVHLGRSVSRVEQVAGMRRVVLDDGSAIEADAVLVAIGAVPATAWLRSSGLDVENGVLCDARCAAQGAERVVAAGDVARWRHSHAGGDSLRIEHWTNAVEQARVAARTLLDGSDAGAVYAPVPSFWSDHFGTRVQSLGLPALADRFETVAGEPGSDRFLAEAYRGQTLVGAVAYDMPGALVEFRSRLQVPAAPIDNELERGLRP